MCVCVCAFAHVCMLHVFWYVYVYVFKCICTYACMYVCIMASPFTTLITVEHKTRGSLTSPSLPLLPQITYLQSKDIEYDARFCTYRGVRWPRAMLKFMVEEVGIPSSRITYLAGGSFVPFRSKFKSHCTTWQGKNVACSSSPHRGRGFVFLPGKQMTLFLFSRLLTHCACSRDTSSNCAQRRDKPAPKARVLARRGWHFKEVCRHTPSFHD